MFFGGKLVLISSVEHHSFGVSVNHGKHSYRELQSRMMILSAQIPSYIKYKWIFSLTSNSEQTLTSCEILAHQLEDVNVTSFTILIDSLISPIRV